MAIEAGRGPLFDIEWAMANNEWKNPRTGETRRLLRPQRAGRVKRGNMRWMVDEPLMCGYYLTRAQAAQAAYG